MALKCPYCGSADVQYTIGDRAQCLNCAGLLNAKGESVDRGPDETTRAVMEARLAPRKDGLVGNLADLQRLGGQEAPNPKNDAFQMPAGTSTDQIIKADDPVSSVSDVQAAMSSTGDVSEGKDGYREPIDPAKQAQADASKQAAADLKKK